MVTKARTAALSNIGIKPKQRRMKAVFLLFVGSIFGSFCAWIAALIQFRTKNRRLFRDVARELLDSVDNVKGDDLTRFYHSSVVSLRNEVAHVLEDIRKGRQMAFRVAWGKYCELGDAPLNMHFETDGKGISKAWMLPHFEAARNAIKTLLREMIENAK
jgi:hypothetical protein